MWEDELAVAHRAYDAFNAKDAEAFVAFCHPDFDFSPMIAGVEGGYRGQAGVRAWLAEMAETFSESAVTRESHEVVDGVMIVYASFRGRGRSSDAEVTQALVHAMEVRDGLLRWFAAYHSRDEALAGIRSRSPPSRAR